MKHLRSLSIGLLLAVTALLLMNCEQKSSTGPSQAGPSWIIGEISLTADNLQLYTVPGVAVTTEITATVSDTGGTAIPGVLVNFSSPQIGSISATEDSTDYQGKVTVTFDSQGETGAATITASASSATGTVSSSITIYVNSLTGIPNKLSLHLDPDILYWTATGVEDSIEVTVTITDSSNLGIPSLQVNLSTTLGILSVPGVTNTYGKTVTYLQAGDEFGTGVVTASLTITVPDTGGEPPDTGDGLAPGSGTGLDLKAGKSLTAGFDPGANQGGPKGSSLRTVADTYTLTDTATFWIVPLDQTVAGLSLEVWPTTVYSAPGQVDSVRSTVWVTDSMNVGIPGVEVNLETTMGVIQGTGVTGPYGSFQTYIQTGQEDEGMGVVTAWVGDYPNSVGGQGSGPQRGIAKGDNISWPGLGTGLPLASKASYSTSSSGSNPRGLDDGFSFFDSDTFWILPISDQVANISLTAEDLDLFTVPGTPISTQITATVTDSMGTATSGVLVHFTTPQIGSISLNQNYTDEFGQARVTFNSQNQFGLATIGAFVYTGETTLSDSITIGVYQLANIPHTVDLVAPDTVYTNLETSNFFPVKAWVMDSLNVGLPNIQVTFSSSIGAITIAPPTNDSGYTSTVVNNINQYTTVMVTATVNTPMGGTISDAASTVVLPAEWEVVDIAVSASPSNLSVPPDTVGSSSVTAIIWDENNRGISGVPIAFGTNLGTLVSSAGITDSTGSTTVTYRSQANAYDTAKVWARVGNLSDTCSIVVRQTSASSGTITLVTDTDLIYADFGITYANITASLKDADNQVIANVFVVFTSDTGNVNSPVLTDSSGTAHAIFSDLGIPTADSALIIAKYNPLNIADTVRVKIAPALGVDHIVLNAASNTMIANGVDSTRVSATVYLESNQLAPAGTIVSFSLHGDNIGELRNVNSPVSETGTAYTYYLVGDNVGTDSLEAEVEGVISNPVVMHLIPGPPQQIDVTLSPNILPVNCTEVCTVRATVLDTSDNFVVDGVGVVFSTEIGSISPLSNVTISGVATSYLVPSTQAGSGYVKATVGMYADSALVTFVESDPASIGLSAQFPTITVQGAGDTTQTAIYAYVRDAYNNLVGNDVMVHFLILNNGFPFGGVNINSPGQIEDSTTTNGGIATVVLNAGTNPGPVQIRAWTYNDSGDVIQAQQSLVTIAAGPPHHIDILPMSLPVDAGGATWQVEVSALVEDAQNNQVPDGITVMFYLLPDSLAQIQGSGYTGNLNWAGNSEPGVVFSTLSYNADEIFRWVTVYAYTMVGEDSIVGSHYYQLPIDANGRLDLSITPQNWNFSNPPPGYLPYAPAVMTCEAWLFDGHNQLINDGTVRLQSPKGQGYWNANATLPSWDKVTGPGGFPNEPPDENGMVTIYLITTYAQAFLDPTSLVSTAQVYAELLENLTIAAPAVVITFERNMGDGAEDPTLTNSSNE